LFLSNSPLVELDALGLATVAFYDGDDPAAAGTAGGADFERAARNCDYKYDITGVGILKEKLRDLHDIGEIITEVYVYDHGGRRGGRQQFGARGTYLTPPDVSGISAFLACEATVYLGGCFVGMTPNGPPFLDSMVASAGGSVKFKGCSVRVFYPRAGGAAFCQGGWITRPRPR